MRRSVIQARAASKSAGAVPLPVPALWQEQPSLDEAGCVPAAAPAPMAVASSIEPASLGAVASSVAAASSRLGAALARRDTATTILPGTLPADVLAARLADGGAYAIIKLGRNFAKILRLIVPVDAHCRKVLGT